MDNKQPDWEISKLYSKSWEIIKKNKLLWIFGLAAAGGGVDFSRSSKFGSGDFEKLFQNAPSPSNTPETFNNVLGAATSSPFLGSIKSIFSGIPFSFYLLLGLEILILMVIVIIINLIYSAWSQGLLLQGTFDGAEDQKVSIERSSGKAIAKIKPLIWLQIVPGLIFALISVLVFAVLAVMVVITPGAFKIIPIILVVVAVGAFIYWLIHLNLAQIWAPRKVLTEDLNGKEAFFSGLRVARKKFWASLLLGVVNNILALFAVFVLIPLIFIAIIGGGIFAFTFKDFWAIFVILGVPLLIAIIIGFSILSGALDAFKAVVWTLAYKQTKGKYDP